VASEGPREARSPAPWEVTDNVNPAGRRSGLARRGGLAYRSPTVPDTYSRDEVKEILGRALEGQRAQAEALTDDELAAVAKEMGVAPEALAAAAASVREERAVAARVGQRVARRRRAWSAHLVVFVMLNALLAAGNALAGGPRYFVLVALGWGLGLALHARAAFAPDRERLAEEARAQLADERRRREAEESVRRLGKAVEVGVVEVLKTVADVIDPARRGGSERAGTGVRVEARGEAAGETAEASSARAGERGTTAKGR